MPTTTSIKVECELNDGTWKQVVDAQTSHVQHPKAVAFTRYNPTYYHMWKNYPRPSGKYIFVLYDIGAFLLIAKLVKPVAKSVVKSLLVFEIEHPLFLLGDPVIAREWDANNFNGPFRKARYSSLTHEQQGITGKKIFEQRKTLRQGLGLWPTTKKQT